MQITNGRVIQYSVIALGMSTITTQIIMLRELLGLLHGNELIIGILLSNWMLLTGTGAWLGKYLCRIRKDLYLIYAFLILVGILPVLTLFLTYYLNSITSLPGQIFSPLEIWLKIFLLLFPYCIISGSLFSIISSSYSNIYNKNKIYQVYGLEAIGSITGGLAFNLVLVFLFETFDSLYILALFNIAGSFLMAIYLRVGLLKVISIFFFLSIVTLPFLTNLDHHAKILQYPGQEIVLFEETAYGKVEITKTGSQVNFYESGNLLFTSEQVEQNEEIIHYAMVQSPDPENILLVAGGISSTLKELTKYGMAKRIDYVELNPRLVELGKEYSEIPDDPRIEIITRDARLFIKETDRTYDVVIVDMGDPVSAKMNRFFTLEFFHEVRRILNEGGVISSSLSAAGNYLSKDRIRVHSGLYNTLSEVFENIIIIPGMRDYFMASDRALTWDITERISELGIENTYINEYYIDNELLKMRGMKILSSLDPTVKINTDFKPVVYYNMIRLWLSHFKIKAWIILVLLILPVPFILFSFNPLNAGMFSTGFTGASIEFMLLIAFQVIYGYVYFMTGIIFTFFMAGLALGSLKGHRLIRRSITNYSTVQALLGALVFILPFIFITLGRYASFHAFSLIIFYLLSVVFGIVTGFQFSQASYLYRSSYANAASKTYGADLIGSAIGALGASIFLVPLLGIIDTCFIIAALNIIVSMVVWFKRRKLVNFA